MAQVKFVFNIFRLTFSVRRRLFHTMEEIPGVRTQYDNMTILKQYEVKM